MFITNEMSKTRRQRGNFNCNQIRYIYDDVCLFDAQAICTHSEQQQRQFPDTTSPAVQQSSRNYVEIEFPQQQQQQQQLSPTTRIAISSDSKNNNAGYATVYHAQDDDIDGDESTGSNGINSRDDSFARQPKSAGSSSSVVSTFQHQPNNIVETLDSSTPPTRGENKNNKATNSHTTRVEADATRIDSSPSSGFFTRTKSNNADHSQHSRLDSTLFRTNTVPSSFNKELSSKDTQQQDKNLTRSPNDHQMRSSFDESRQQKLKSDPTGQQGIIEYEDIELNKNNLLLRQQQQQQQRKNLEPFHFKPIDNTNSSNINTPTSYEDMSADFTAVGDRLHFESPQPPELPTKGPKLPVKRTHTAPSASTSQQFRDSNDVGDESVPHFIPPKPTSSSMKSRDHHSLYENQEINLSSRNGMGLPVFSLCAFFIQSSIPINPDKSR